MVINEFEEETRAEKDSRTGSQWKPDKRKLISFFNIITIRSLFDSAQIIWSKKRKKN